MVDEINRHVESGTPLKRIILVGFASDLTHAFGKALQKSPPNFCMQNKAYIE